MTRNELLRVWECDKQNTIVECYLGWLDNKGIEYVKRNSEYIIRINGKCYGYSNDNTLVNCRIAYDKDFLKEIE